MRRLGIYGLPKRRLPRGAKVGKPSKPNALDLVRRRFSADVPDRLWMTDITEHPTSPMRQAAAVSSARAQAARKALSEAENCASV
jgi:putative transposase